MIKYPALFNHPINVSISKGFTLIELLVVIAILGVLATVLIVLLDPGDKIKSGSDAKVLQNVREIYGANQRYMAQNSGSVGTSATLVSSGELKAYPAPPSNYAAYVLVANTANTDVVVAGEVQSKGARSKTVGGVGGNMMGNGPACVSTGAAGTCYFIITGNKSCYKYNSTPASAVPVANEVCP